MSGSDTVKKRKRIGLAMVNPETAYQSRVLDGLITQCERYDYDIISFTPLVDIWFYKRDYLSAEMNIFELIDFDMIDALVVAAISLTRNDDYEEVRRFERFLREYSTKPVVSVDLPMEGCEYISTEDAPAFSRIAAHILDVHKVSPEDIYVLTGRKDLDISINRVNGVRNEFARRGYELDDSRVFYGDYWYPSGAEMADRIISGELKMPRAVICGSDHMAIGLANRLVNAGIKIPEQVLVTGYDATQDAVTNEIPITSFEPNVKNAAQQAVNLIHRRIDPDEPEIPADEPDEKSLCLGSSCGCQINLNYLRSNLRLLIYKTAHDYSNGFVNDDQDMSTVIESYMLEQLTAAKTPDDCLEQIYLLTYLIRPYRNFYLCLRPDWLNAYRTLRHGYPDIMKMVIHTIPEGQQGREDTHIFYSDTNGEEFPLKKLLPVLDVPRDKAGVFYFVPVHFQGDTLGYAVLHCDLADRVKPTAVFRNWVRNVNNALEMMRAQNRLLSYSLYDSMTGLLNRRGMDRSYTSLCRAAEEGDSCLALVIDMNRLKNINDTYGHAEGDTAIMQLAHCAASIASDDRFIAVRAGGDEFYVIGLGRFDEGMAERKREALLKAVSRIDAESGKDYTFSASVGCCQKPYTPSVKLEELLHEADVQMYEHKKHIKQTLPFKKHSSSP